MDLTKKQSEVFEQIKSFLTGDDQVFVLQGYAGTGKTTLMKEVVRYAMEEKIAIQLMAPTGRAANVLQQKTGHTASTIHRGIYNFAELVVEIDRTDISRSKFKFHYPIRETDMPTVCIVDEASMLSNHNTEGELWSFGTNHLLDDLLSYTRLENGGKLIFVGDPAQLPPVGEASSVALKTQYYQERGLRTQSAELREVMRQKGGSDILDMAEKIRDTHKRGRYNALCIEEGEGIAFLTAEKVASLYCSLFPTPELGNSAIICYSNKLAMHYNRQVRGIMYGNEDEPLREGDVMMVVTNHYDKVVKEGHMPIDIMNGEFVKVLSLGEKETHHAPVWVNNERKKIELEFTQATIQLSNGDTWDGKLLTQPLLSQKEGKMDISIIKALYIDFCMRHPNESKNPKSEAFQQALKEDPYLNAVHARYGYAVTCHKSQGGEWDVVFVDYEGIRLDSFGSRWMYTATTRARKQIYAINMPQVTPLGHLKMNAISRLARTPQDWPMPVCAPTEAKDCPFDMPEDKPYLNQKYAEIMEKLDGEEWTIANIQHFPYRERYTFRSMLESEVVDMMYNGKGEFRPIAIANADLRAILQPSQQAEKTYPELNYEPEDNALVRLHERMLKAAEQTGVKIVNVTPHIEHWHIVYCLQTDNKSMIDFFFDRNMFITYANPQSMAGESDTKLQLLLTAFGDEN